MGAPVSLRRTTRFRIITTTAAGLGSFTLGLWGMQVGFGGQTGGLHQELLGGLIATLCALAAIVASLSFFAGIDESADYVFNETQIDKLTGFHARVSIIGKVAEAASRSARTGQPYYMVDIDINRFKQINDRIGYVAGDELIAAFANRVKSLVPDNVVLGRIGAGEFVLIYPDNDGMDAIDTVVQQLIDALHEPYPLSSHVQSVTLSVGIVAIPKDGIDPIVLLRRSNLALQNARASGIGNWAVFEPDMGRVADYRQWIEAELHLAFERGDFDLHYQPQLDLSSGKTVGYEALLRWQHPERGVIPPSEFVPIAEETGMINLIGDWVLRKACRDAQFLPEECFVAVNISPVQFMTKDFVGQVSEALQRAGLDASRLELEITETAMMQDRDRAAQILDRLSAMGISVAVDDFGTGYSNLSYLMDFSFHKIKIDRSFVNRIDSDNSTGALVSTIVGLSRALGVRTIAEGVETESQATLLRAAGCEVVQGYLVGQPAPLMVLQNEAKRVAALN